MSFVQVRSAKSLLVTAALVTLAVSPSTNYDPISVVKLLVLSTCALALFFLWISQGSKVLYELGRAEKLFAGGFIFAMVSTVMFSGAPITQQIFGAFGRNTGFLAYFSLLVVLIVTSSLKNRDFYQTIPKFLIGVTIPMLAYCGIQIAGLDPIKWSEFATFGTLGNINFLSAFLGLSAVIGFILCFSSSLEKKWRVAAFTTSTISVPVILSTGSIQGFVILLAGITFAIGLVLLKYRKYLLFLPFSALVIAGVFLTIQGLANKGILAKFLYQPSVVYRGDYMHAGWEMTLDRPWFGVGLDSYGDWYRQERGEISTLRTGPERISNSAHNIFLDISSNGGFPLLFFYGGLLSLALLSSIRYLRASAKMDLNFLALFSAWVAYQIQAAVSINQLGVGVWGWLFTGALIGYGKINESDLNPAPVIGKGKSAKKRKIHNQIPAKAAVAMIAGSAVGFSLAFIPWNADVKYKSALQKRVIVEMMKSVDSIGSTSFHSELVISAAMSINAFDQAKETSFRLVRERPRNFFGWKVISLLPNVTETERTTALAKLRALDPYNPDIPKS